MHDSLDHTVDAFHRGAFYLAQPAKKGHRAGTDAMMLAASVPSTFCGHLIDLGAGAGAAGLGVAARCPQARVTLLERSAAMAGYARLSIALPQNAHLRERADLIVADVRMSDAKRRAVLPDFSFDWAIMNPPFNNALDRASPDGLRREAHVMEDGLFERWLRTAAAIVKPRGGLALIARPRSLPAILAAIEGRFGDARIVPVLPRPDEPAIRIVLRAVRGSRAALSLMPALAIHDADSDRFAARAEAISNGRATLFGD